MPRKLTQEDVLGRFRSAHGDRYDYSQTAYVNSGEKVTVICREHGPFHVLAGHHMKGTGCRKCYFDSQKITREDFIKRSQAHHGERYDYGLVPDPFPGTQAKVSIRCREHACEFEQDVSAHMGGHTGCMECRSEIGRGSKNAHGERITVAEATALFVERAREAHGDRYDYSGTVYRSLRDPVTIHCPDHGPFHHDPANHLRGKGCKICANEAKGKGSLKERCKELGLNYWRIQKRVLAGMPEERALREGFVRADRETATALTVHGTFYPNIEEACRQLQPKASPTTIARWVREGLSPEEAFNRDPKPGFAGGTIYKVTQLSTGRSYIGQTVQKLDDRWASHVQQARNESISSDASLHHAIREFCADDFEIEQIDVADSPETLRRLEREWIDRFQTLAPDGFNLNRGGSTGGSLKKPCDVDGKRFESQKAAIKYVMETRNISRSAAAKRLQMGKLDVKAPAKKGESRVKTKEYKAWSGMKDAVSPRSKYFLPGVDLHPAWRADFDVWLKDVGMAPSPRHRFVRIDKRQGFVPANCAWMTPKEDMEARKASGMTLFNGVKPLHVRNCENRKL
ncbi:GIY-YIG nuclease family protein [Jannaschia formosa]|uniref:GIY-YIG nuclease family protein n=1 Tax=Jannaschia formosa TaxID=2259592 RepID=UPI000E1BEBEB|nr:GIY-YIG nuclease family protein [Jannaschia formosa]TFL16039.1 GIY-YIG nuclease family protein [Jannaschia formosa]